MQLLGIELPIIQAIFFYIVVSSKWFSGRIRWNVYKRKSNLNLFNYYRLIKLYILHRRVGCILYTQHNLLKYV